MTYFLRYLGAMVLILVAGGIFKYLLDLSPAGPAVRSLCRAYPSLNDLIGWSWIALLLLGPAAITPSDE